MKIEYDEYANPDLGAERLLANIFPTRFEMVLRWLAGQTWKIMETGPIGWVGGKLSDAATHSANRRAEKIYRRKQS